MPRLSLLRGATAGTLLACVVGVLSAAPATAGSSGHPKANTYLALGDSVSFGYDPRLAQPGVEPNVFVGYPHLAAWWSRPTLKLTNASCPAETSTSLITGTGPDNGCRVYRSSVGDLHVSYPGSQLQFATGYVAAHPRTTVISLMVGANDLLLLQKSCTQTDPATVATCITTGLPPLLAQLRTNIATIYRDLRAAGFTGRFVAVTYYSTDYTDPVATGAISAVNDVLTAVTEAVGGTVADGFTALAEAAAPSGGDTCAAGLLIRLTPDTCDIHPSPAGDRLLASALRFAVKHNATGGSAGARAG